ncbi:MAG TPA: D-alanyl-D-alanine carboxypeptidase/D-alanyl-D-alanine-endopeptidase [Candidatus Angelobacter sp.]|nr:D-alanyl-D-alanine carboxypeptidase/D-alanyl-D-alanine-endopeptidase [Candidatus Angelobacter sp.]
MFRSRCLPISFFAIAFQLFAFASSTPAVPPKTAKNNLANGIQAILKQPQLSRAQWGIDVIDLESGDTLYALNADHLFLPASNAKLLTTASILATAGPDYRFHTTIETSGDLGGDGRLLGNLNIVGRGDPNISGRVMPYQLKTERVSPPTQVLEDLADQLVQRGVKIVDGDVVGDDTFYAPERYAEGWAQDDLQWLDGAPVSALSFNDNVVFLKVLPAERLGEKALVTVDPPTDYYEVENRIVTVAAGVARKIGIHRDLGSRKLILWGWTPLADKGYGEALSIEDPAEFTAQIFRGLLEKRGITITGKTRAQHGDVARFYDQPSAPPGVPAVQPATSPAASAPINPAPILPLRVLAEHVSLPLLEDLRVTNKTSQNLHAELALRLLSELKGTGGSFEGGTAAVKQFLLQAGIKEEEFYLQDGSGLSRRDLVTPNAIAQLLRYASRQTWGAQFEQTLPTAGLDGSLAERFLKTPAAGLVHAKTGTLGHVNALSGYGQTESGRRFAFSILCNNHNLRSANVLTAIDSIVKLLVEQLGR